MVKVERLVGAAGSRRSDDHEDEDDDRAMHGEDVASTESVTDQVGVKQDLGL